MNFLAIIPARFGSSRLEGKPLADICGKPMIQHVYEQALKAINNVYVATDDKRIKIAVKSFGGNVVMTSKEHNSGTNRCLEAYNIIQQDSEIKFDVVVNIQGDEPMLSPDQINELIACFDNPKTEIATLIAKITKAEDLEDLTNAFVIFDTNMKSIYFSRSVIPGVKDVPKSEWLDNADFYKHLGMYGYRPETLEQIANLQQSKLEIAEGLEQNRWIENNYPVHVAISKYNTSMSVDTQEDLENIRKIMCK